MLDRLGARASRLWHDLARPVDYPHDQRAWAGLIQGVQTMAGPYDWSLRCGSVSNGRRPTGSAELTLAWRDGDVRAGQVLGELLTGLVVMLERHVHLDGLIGLPRGYRSTPHEDVMALLDQTRISAEITTGFWHCGMASAYRSLPEDETVRVHALRPDRVLSAGRILMVEDYHVRHDLAADCDHLLRQAGAAWVGFLALVEEE